MIALAHNHTILDNTDLFCRHCGTRETVLPVRVSAKRLAALRMIGEAFSEEHERCIETDKSPSRRSVTDPHAWWNGGDTGLSSKAIWSAAMGMPRADRSRVPRDPDDFGRCHRLLTAFPWMRAKLPDLADSAPSWVPFVREWNRLAALYERDLPTGTCPELYEEMQKLLEEAGQ